MNSQNTIEKANLTKKQEEALNVLYELSINIDPNLDRLRRCPESREFFFTDHLGRDFLTDKHQEKHYNKRRANFLKSVPGNIPTKILSAMQAEADQKVKEEITNVTVVAPVPAVDPMEKIRVKDADIIKSSQDFLRATLGDQDAIEVHVSFFNSPNFNINAFDEIQNFPNSTKTYVIYGEYVLCWREEEVLLLTHLKNMLWTLE